MTTRNDVAWTPRHTKEELNDAAIAAQEGGEREAEKLRQMMRPYVVQMTQRYDRLGDYSRHQSDEMKQSIWLGVWLALQNFCPEPHEKRTKGGPPSCPGRGKPHNGKGKVVKFSTFARGYMQREVHQWMAKHSRALPLSRRAWEQSRGIEAAFAEQYPDEDIAKATDEQLAAIEINDPEMRGEKRKVEQAGDILRAKKMAYEIDPELDTRYSDSAESDYFEVAHDADADALLTVQHMLDADDDDHAFSIALDFCDRHALDLTVADNMMEVRSENLT